MPLAVVEQVADKLVQAIDDAAGGFALAGRSMYVLDGSTILVSHTAKNIERYPQYRNQYGAAHFPLVRVGVATNAITGTALRPAYGPYNGTKACGEIPLAEELLKRLPPESVVLGDRYYGCFRFLSAATKQGHDVLCRIIERNSKRFIGTTGSETGERAIEWTPSADERRKYPDLPADAVVKGRMVWATTSARGFRSTKLILFTTLDLPVEKLVELYAQRWNVELDLRHIKTTIGLEFIEAKTPDMIAKELILAVCAYNLIRHTMNWAARSLKLAPRAISFTQTLNMIGVLGELPFSGQPTDKQYAVLQRALRDLKFLVLYKRKRPRTAEPRKVWPRGQKKTFRSSTTRQAEKRSLNRTKKQQKPKPDGPLHLN